MADSFVFKGDKMEEIFEPRYKNVTPDQVLKDLMSLSQDKPAAQQKRAVIYIRKSRMVKDEEAYSPIMQEKACREFAAKEGIQIVATIKDLDRSGRNSDREGFQRLMKMIRTGDVDYVIVQYLDREFRNGISFIQFYDFIQKYGVQFLSVNENLDTRTFTGRFMLFVLAVAAELPVWTASERVRKAKQERRQKGLHNGGYRLGYCNGLCSTCTDPNGKDYCPLYGKPDRPESQRGRIQVPHPIEQHAIRLISHLYNTGMSTREIATFLNLNHFLLPDNDLKVKFRTKLIGREQKIQAIEQGDIKEQRTVPGEFSSEGIADILRNPFYAGLVAHFPTPDLNMQDNIQNPKKAKAKVKNRRTPDELHPGLHQPLITEKQWENNKQMLAARRSRTSNAQTPKRTYILAGIARCAICEQHTAPGQHASLRGSTNGSQKQVYRCAKLSNRSQANIAITGDIVTLSNLGIKASPDPDAPDLFTSHNISSYPAQSLEKQVEQLVFKFSFPESWYEDILAYATSKDGPSSQKLKRRNLLRELERAKEMYVEGLLDNAKLKTIQVRISKELAQLDPRVDPRLKKLIPLLDNFQSLWMKMTPEEQNAILKLMFEGLYFDGEGRLVEARAYAPFDKLLGLTQ